MVKLESDSSDGDIPMTTKDRIDELFSDRLSEDDLKYILEKKLNLNSVNETKGDEIRDYKSDENLKVMSSLKELFKKSATTFINQKMDKVKDYKAGGVPQLSIKSNVAFDDWFKLFKLHTGLNFPGLDAFLSQKLSSSQSVGTRFIQQLLKECSEVDGHESLLELTLETKLKIILNNASQDSTVNLMILNQLDLHQFLLRLQEYYRYTKVSEGEKFAKLVKDVVTGLKHTDIQQFMQLHQKFEDRLTYEFPKLTVAEKSYTEQLILHFVSSEGSPLFQNLDRVYDKLLSQNKLFLPVNVIGFLREQRLLHVDKQVVSTTLITRSGGSGGSGSTSGSSSSSGSNSGSSSGATSGSGGCASGGDSSDGKKKKKKKRSHQQKDQNKDHTSSNSQIPLDQFVSNEFNQHYVLCSTPTNHTDSSIIVDSASTINILPKELLHNYQECHETIRIDTLNGSYQFMLAGKGMFNLALSSQVIIEVPAVSLENENFSLISLDSITREGYTVSFSREMVSISTAEGTVINAAFAIKSEDLFVLSDYPSTSDTQVPVTSKVLMSTGGSEPNSETEDKLKNLHVAMGHLSFKRLKALVPDQMNVPLRVLKKLQEQCVGCVQAKMTKEVKKKGLSTKVNDFGPGELIYIDGLGPNHGIYSMVFLDAVTSYSWLVTSEYPINGSTVAKVLRAIIQKLTVSGKAPRYTVSDNGSNIKNQSVQNILAEQGVQQLFSAPYEHTARAENQIKIIKNVARGLVVDLGSQIVGTFSKDIQSKIWELALQQAVMLLNTTSEGDVTPAAMLQQYPMTQSIHAPFLSSVVVYNHKSSNKSDMTFRGLKAIFIGNSSSSRGAIRYWMITDGGKSIKTGVTSHFKLVGGYDHVLELSDSNDKTFNSSDSSPAPNSIPVQKYSYSFTEDINLLEKFLLSKIALNEQARVESHAGTAKLNHEPARVENGNSGATKDTVEAPNDNFTANSVLSGDIVSAKIDSANTYPSVAKVSVKPSASGPTFGLKASSSAATDRPLGVDSVKDDRATSVVKDDRATSVTVKSVETQKEIQTATGVQGEDDTIPVSISQAKIIPPSSPEPHTIVPNDFTPPQANSTTREDVQEIQHSPQIISDQSDPMVVDPVPVDSDSVPLSNYEAALNDLLNQNDDPPLLDRERTFQIQNGNTVINHHLQLDNDIEMIPLVEEQINKQNHMMNNNDSNHIEGVSSGNVSINQGLIEDVKMEDYLCPISLANSVPLPLKQLDYVEKSTQVGPLHVQSGTSTAENHLAQTRTRSGRVVKPTSKVKENLGKRFVVNIAIVGDESKAPKSFNEVLKRKDKSKWVDSMVIEGQTLRDFGTWSLVKKNSLPVGTKILPTIWVYNLKDNGDHTVKYKSRLVVNGALSVDGVHFHSDNMYAETVTIESVRLFVILACEYGQAEHICQFDVTNAFVHSPLEDEIYIHIPPGVGGDRDTYCLKLHKSLYGCKQAPANFFMFMVSLLEQLHFQKSNVISSCFFRHEQDASTTFLLLYVDDMLVFNTGGVDTKVFSQLVEAGIWLKNLGSPQKFLGMDIQISKEKVLIHSKSFIENLLSKLNLNHLTGTFTPFSDLEEENEQTGKPLSPRDHHLYRCLVGNLVWLVTTTRFDLAFTVTLFGSYLEKPCFRHLEALFKVFRYLKQCPEVGVVYLNRTSPQADVASDIGKTTEFPFTVHCYTDASHSNMSDFHTTRGHFIYLNAHLVTWKSSKIRTITTSTFESETLAASFGVLDTLGLQLFLKELEFKINPIKLWIDNQAALAVINKVGNKPKRYIGLRYAFLQELVQRKVIHAEYIRTEDNIADLPTKSFARVKFNQLKSLAITPAHLKIEPVDC